MREWIRAGAAGILVGASTAVFLLGLQWVTAIRLKHPQLIWTLPIAGLAVVWLHQRSPATMKSVLAGIPTPLWSGPVIVINTWLTHLFGGSAGREGTAVIMAAGLLDRLGLRRYAVAAGFAAVFGVPFAGAIFSRESQVEASSSYSIYSLALYLWCTWLAHLTCLALGVKHLDLAALELVVPGVWTWMIGLQLLTLTLGLMVVAKFYLSLFEWCRRFFEKRLASPFIRIAVVGGVIVGITQLPHANSSLGLSLPLLETVAMTANSPIVPVGWLDVIYKVILTILTLAAGFRGGEVTPLLVIGACFGFVFGDSLGLDAHFAGALGLVAVFAGATARPLTGFVMAIELLGFGTLGLIAAVVAWLTGQTVPKSQGLYADVKEKSPQGGGS